MGGKPIEKENCEGFVIPFHVYNGEGVFFIVVHPDQKDDFVTAGPHEMC